MRLPSLRRESSLDRFALPFALLILASASLLVFRPAFAGEPGRKDDSGVQVIPLPPSRPAAIPEDQRLPPIPPDRLPPRTRPKPDPSKERYVLQPVYVWVEEEVKPEKGDPFEPAGHVTENYLKGYLSRAGYPAATASEQAFRRFEGSVSLRFHSRLTARDQTVAWKYTAEASFRILEGNGDEVSQFDIPEVRWDGVISEESTVRSLQRYLSKVIWENLSQKALSKPRIVGLINAFSIEGEQELPTEQGKGPRLVKAEEVVKALADCGLEAVPYLLEALTDERFVKLESHYAGLPQEKLGDLRVYHMADKTLEEIFQKISRMSLDTDSRTRFVIIAGWENEWARFCPPFADMQEKRKAERERATRARKDSSAPGEKEAAVPSEEGSEPSRKEEPGGE